MTERTPGALIDELYALRAARLKLQRDVDALKAEEQTLKNKIIEELDQLGLARGSGATATAGITTALQPYVEDWDAVYKYIVDHNIFNLLQRRLSTTTWRELVESGIHVPGTFVTEVRDISLTKSRG